MGQASQTSPPPRVSTMMPLTASVLVFAALIIFPETANCNQQDVTAQMLELQQKFADMQVELNEFKVDMVFALNEIKEEVSAIKGLNQESLARKSKRHAISRRRREAELHATTDEANDPSSAASAEDVDAVDNGFQNLERRLEAIEAKLHKTSARSCDALLRAGQTVSGLYLIDPDGADVGEPPIRVYCNFNTEKGTVETVIKHDSGSLNVTQCSSSGCSKHDIHYDASIRQINTLVDISMSCSQQITYHCYDAPLSLWETFHNAWWIGRDPETKNYYWDGVRRSEHTCACGLQNNCTVESFLKCNCDAGAPAWFSDDGEITEKGSLPIRSLHFGGLKYASQQARVELGPLKCSGMDVNVLTRFDSCLAIKAAGHRASGYYFLDSKDTNGTKAARIAECNFDVEPVSPRFEKTIRKTHHTVVVFSAYRTQSISGDSRGSGFKVLKYDGVDVNRGGGLDVSIGRFTAPVSGLYFFSFTARTTGEVRLYKDELIYASAYGSSYEPFKSMSAVLSLEVGDMVYIQHQSDVTSDNYRRTQFVGFLLPE